MAFSHRNNRYIQNAKNLASSKKRTKDQKEADINFCIDLFIKNYSYAKITEKLNERNQKNGLGYSLTIRTVWMDIKSVLDEWRKNNYNDIDAYIHIELKKLDKIENELWEAWDKSKSISKRTKIKGGILDGNHIKGGEIESRQLDDNNGDPRYLELLLKVQERRARLLGYERPVKVDVYNANHKEENTINVNYDFKDIPDNILIDIADKLQDAEYKKRNEEVIDAEETK